MLTRDNNATAKWVADQVGLDEDFAEVLPRDMAARVKEVQARGVLVAMTGDGVTDAPAPAQADLGIAGALYARGVRSLLCWAQC